MEGYIVRDGTADNTAIFRMGRFCSLVQANISLRQTAWVTE